MYNVLYLELEQALITNVYATFPLSRLIDATEVFTKRFSMRLLI